MPRRFAGSILVTLACLVAAGAYGGWAGHSPAAGMAAVWVALVLALLEVSLSFDNAVVNAAVLGEMDPVWQRRFLTWGMGFAVFGTRVVFPLAIVATTAGLGPAEALRLSLEEPARYEAILRAAHIAISGFGGAFLTMVGLGFFTDPNKQVDWFGWVEARMRLLGAVKAGGMALVLAAMVLIARALTPAQGLTYLVAGTLGIIMFVAVDGLGAILAGRAQRRALLRSAARSGLGGFVYLNLLDASFSLDGVIGAFALSNNMVIIALGLSIGAIFVRSLTVVLVEQGALAQFRYLEHGAFWAILALGLIMVISVLVTVPQVVTGLVGAALIAGALGWSWRHRQRTSL